MANRIDRKTLIEEFSDVVKQEVINSKRSLENKNLEINEFKKRTNDKVEQNFKDLKSIEKKFFEKAFEIEKNFEKIFEKLCSLEKRVFFLKNLENKNNNDLVSAFERLSKQEGALSELKTLTSLFREEKNHNILKINDLGKGINSIKEDFSARFESLKQDLKADLLETPSSIIEERKRVEKWLLEFESKLFVIKEKLSSFSEKLNKCQRELEFLIKKGNFE